MIRKYTNTIIYKNINIVWILSLVSLCLSIVTVCIYIYNLLMDYWQFEPVLGDFDIIYFVAFACLIPSNLLTYSRSAMNIPKTPVNTPFEMDPKDETKLKKGYFKFSNKLLGKPYKKIDDTHWLIHETISFNDIRGLCRIIILTYLHYTFTFFILLLFVCFGAPSPIGMAQMCGYLLPAHICSYVASGFLISNIVLIKREWKSNPPHFIAEKQNKRQERAQREKSEQDDRNIKELTEKCGMRFFIKYYKQIRRLPLRDVVIEENYSTIEKEERVLAAKKIIDFDLTEKVLRNIIENYGDSLNSSEVDQANNLLKEITISADSVSDKEDVGETNKFIC